MVAVLGNAPMFFFRAAGKLRVGSFPVMLVLLLGHLLLPKPGTCRCFATAARSPS